MEIKLKEIKIRDLVKGYVDKSMDEEGIVGYSGLLNIRPKYQREFVYKPEQQKSVINTVINNFPLNVMYWVKNQDGTFELLDGQQRTISICEFVDGNFSIKVNNDDMYFHSLTDYEKERILNYSLMVYFCEGNDKEKLDWFKTINIAGEELTDQELRNAVYTGEWLTDAKRYFSKTGCAAYSLGSDYLKGKPIRQEYLETAIKWISNDNINEYMSKNQHNSHATELWKYYENVINWVKSTFTEKRKEMKFVEWGFLYNEYKDVDLNPKEIEAKIKELMMDEDVTRKSGIYYYILTGKEKHLNIRSFTDNQKRIAYEKQKGVCPMCGKGKKYSIEEMEADHKKPWHEGGKTEQSNCQMLCKMHNREKSGK